MIVWGARSVMNHALVKPRSRRSQVVLRATVAALIGWSLLAWVLARMLTVSVALERADVIFIFSGSSEYQERARRAARLYNQGLAPKIVITNDNLPGPWSDAKGYNPLSVERAADELKANGVPAAAIVSLMQPVSGTYDEAVLLRRHAAAHGVHSILAVTSAYHSRRAMWSLRRAFRGADVEIGLDAVSADGENSSPGFWWLSARGWRTVGVEFPKTIYYWLRYY